MSRILIVAGLVLVCASLVQGARDIEFNVDFFCGWDGYYRPMEWTPVEIGVTSNSKEPFSGSFTLGARQDGLNNLHIVHRFVLTPDRPLSVPLVTKFAFAVDQCRLAIRDEKGRTRWQQTVNTWDYSTQNRMLRVVQEQDLLVGLLGGPQFRLMQLPQETTCVSDRSAGKVYLGQKVPRAAPWDWTGYASLDVLVICDLDWSLLQPQQNKAICEWISNGGTVLLVLGQYPLPPDSPLARFLPFRMAGPAQVEIPSQTLEAWGLDPNQAQTVTAWTLTPKPGALIDKTIDGMDTAGLFGAGYAGFGRVAVLGFNPSQLAQTQARRSAAFWTRMIAACCRPPAADASRSRSASGRRIALTEESSQSSGGMPTGFNPSDNSYRLSIAQNASNQVMDYLYQLEQMRPLSIWWVVLTLMALAVLLGPVDYFVLKRLDKLPYTWLTSVGWIALFTVGAYFGVQWLRGGSMEVRAVSVLDGIADSNCTWATSYTSLFAPHSGDYQLSGLASNQWWSGISPTQQELWTYQRDAGMQQIYCAQVDGGNLPVSLPINMWTVQPLLSEGTGARVPLTATVQRKTIDATIEITNNSDNAIVRGCVLFGYYCADIGPVPAHATKRFDVRTRPFRAWQPAGAVVHPAGRRGQAAVQYTGDIPAYPDQLGNTARNAFLAQGCLSRTLGMHTCLEQGAALVCVVYEEAPLPIEVKDRTYKVNHIQLARLLVLPKKVVGSQ